MPLRQVERCLVSIFIYLSFFSIGISPQGYESDGSTVSGSSGNTRIASSSGSTVQNGQSEPRPVDPSDVRLTTVRETLAENDLNTPLGRPGYESRTQNFPSPNYSPPQDQILQTQRTVYTEKEATTSFCDWFSFRGSGRVPDTCRTRDNSPSDTRYDISPSTSRRGSNYGGSQQPMQQVKYGGQINLPNLQLNSQRSVFNTPGSTFRGYGTLNPQDTARGTSRKLEQIPTLKDEDEEPALPTEPDEDDPTTFYDNVTPNLDISTPDGESFAVFQSSRSQSKGFARKLPNISSGGLKPQKINRYVNSVTWFKPGADIEDSSELTRLESVWQGEFLQPSDAKGFLLTLLNALTDDLWVVVKGGFPYKGYNLFTQKFAEGDAARWVKIDRRLQLADSELVTGKALVVYTCKGGKGNAALGLIDVKEARFLENKPCPQQLGDGIFKSWGWELRRSKSVFVDPRIEGTLYWEGATETGNLQSIYPPEDDNKLWWSTKKAGGGRRRVPLVAFLALPENWNPTLSPGPETTDLEKLTRKLPYLARYKPVETDNSGFVDRFELGLWLKREFQISGTFINAAKTSTLVPWHIYVEESPRRLPALGKSSIDRFLVARLDGRETVGRKPTIWRAKQVRPEGLGITQTRVYQLPLDNSGYEFSRYIYVCNGSGVFLRVGTQKEAIRECGRSDLIYSNFEFFVSYFSYKGTQDAHHEGTEMVFKPGENLQGLRAMSLDTSDARPSAARLYVVEGYNYVFDGKIILHAEMFA